MKLIPMAAAFILASGAAVAGQEHQPNPNPSTAGTSSSVSGAAALSASRSQATAASASRATGGRSNATGGASNVTVNNGSGGSGGGYTARGNTPDVISTGVVTANPCGVGGGLGGSGPGGGGFLSFVFGSDRCERRQDAQVMWTMGDRAAALELMCTNSDVRWARYRSGNPCRQEIERWNRGER